MLFLHVSILLPVAIAIRVSGEKCIVGFPGCVQIVLQRHEATLHRTLCTAQLGTNRTVLLCLTCIHCLKPTGNIRSSDSIIFRYLFFYFCAQLTHIKHTVKNDKSVVFYNRCHFTPRPNHIPNQSRALPLVQRTEASTSIL